MTGLWPAGWAPSGPSAAATAQAAPLILTLALPDALQREADAVRAAAWPEAAQRAPAHCTLFRHLPGLHQDALVRLLRRVRPAARPDFDVAPPVRWGGRWVAPLVAPVLDRLRADLADSLHGLLAPGDLAPPRLHISLSDGRAAPITLPPGPWRARGLLLWRRGASAAEQAGPARAAEGGRASFAASERGRPTFAAERGRPTFAAERGGPFWTPLVAVGFHG